MLLLKGGNVLDGCGNLRENTDVLIDGKTIRKIAPLLSTIEESLDKVIDVSGNTVMPGLIDCHVHLTKGTASGETRYWEERAPGDVEKGAGFLCLVPEALRDVLTGVHNAKRTLEAGYTTICEVGGASEYADIALREAIKLGLVPGPRILACGGGITMTGGHAWVWSGFQEADGPDHTRKIARTQLKAGADLIKLMATSAGASEEFPGTPELTVEEMRSICREAHKVGKRVAAHAIGPEGIKNAIKAGVDRIEHGCLIDDEGIDMMVENGTYLTTTLFAFNQQATRSTKYGYPKFVAKRSHEIMKIYPDKLRKARARGVKLCLGSDCGMLHLTPHGENAAEIGLLISLVGIDAMEAIELATRCGAEALGLGKETGTLHEGKLADIIVVGGDPLRDIEVLKKKIRIVIKEGKIVVEDSEAIKQV